MANRAIRVVRWILFWLLALFVLMMAWTMLKALSLDFIRNSPDLRKIYLEGYPVVIALGAGLAWVVRPRRQRRA